MSKPVMSGPLLTPPHIDQCYQAPVNQSVLGVCDISVISTTFATISKLKDVLGGDW